MITIVTQDDIAFSTTSGYGIQGVIVSCSKIIVDKNGKTCYIPTEMNGLNFESADVAEQMALKKGYLKYYSRNNTK